MPRGIVEGRIHQHRIDTVRSQAGGGKGCCIGLDIEHDHVCVNRVRICIGARKARQRRIDLDQNQIDAGHAPGNREARDARAGAEIGDAVARTGCDCRREQHRIVTGAMSRFQLPHAQLPAEKRILGEF
jgi:hypothetical protein